jgi:hypothetical protein
VARNGAALVVRAQFSRTAGTFGVDWLCGQRCDEVRAEEDKPRAEGSDLLFSAWLSVLRASAATEEAEIDSTGPCSRGRSCRRGRNRGARRDECERV